MANENGRRSNDDYDTNIRVNKVVSRGGGRGIFCVSQSRGAVIENVDLANNLGNLVSRVTAMANRYRRGRLTPTAAPSDVLARLGDQAATDYRAAMDGFALHEGAAAAYRLIDGTNEFIAATSPWALAPSSTSPASSSTSRPRATGPA